MPLLRGNIITGENHPGISDGIIEFTDTIHWIGSVADYMEAHGVDDIPVPVQGYISPGLVDVHCHGAAGGSFPSSDWAGVQAAIQYHQAHGTTSLVASTVSAGAATLLERIDILSEAVRAGLLVGIHLEGPFLSTHRCGAQDPKYIIPGDPVLMRRLLDQADGTVLSMTLAPETAYAEEIAHILCEYNAIASWGHSSASTELAHKALSLKPEISSQGEEIMLRGNTSQAGNYAAKKNTITHMFNAMNPFHHRDPGMVGEAFQALHRGTVAAELIADGVHLSRETIALMFSWFSAEQLLLVSDAMEATGKPDGVYTLGTHQVQVREGVARVLDNDVLGSIAGSTSTLADIVKYTVQRAGVPIHTAICAATLSPAQALGLARERGSLTVGKRADIVQWSPELCPEQVYIQGVCV